MTTWFRRGRGGFNRVSESDDQESAVPAAAGAGVRSESPSLALAAGSGQWPADALETGVGV